jgi:membrane protein implicated in regulation of membrane protease activity
MDFRKIKVGNSLILLIVLYFLGYTHFLGGPYGLAKFFFLVVLFGTLILLVTTWWVARFAKRLLKKQMEKSRNMSEEKGETIKVDAKIIE